MNITKWLKYGWGSKANMSPICVQKLHKDCIMTEAIMWTNEWPWISQVTGQKRFKKWERECQKLCNSMARKSVK